MSKLKTLKDIIKTTDDNFFEQDMKREAIKWIKSFEKEIEEHAYVMGECSCEKHHNDFSCELKRAKIEWIKKFFNITEKDI